MDLRAMRVRPAACRLMPIAVTVVALAGCSGSRSDVVDTAQGFVAQPLPGASSAADAGLSVVASGSETIPADEAVVVVTAPFDDFDGTGGEFDESARTAIRAALQGLGIEDADVAITASSASGYTFFEGDEVRVEVPVANLADRADEINDAVEGAVDEIGDSGVRFYLSECTSALASLQQSTVEEAIADAGALAEAADVTLGELRTVREVSSPDAIFTLGYPQTTACPDGTVGPLASADSPPEVRLRYSAEVVFELTGAPEADLTGESLGSGSVTVPADRATVVVTAAVDDYGVGSAIAIDAEARDAIERAMAELGLDTEGIRFTIGDDFDGIPTTIEVPIDLSRLAEVSEDVVDAVGDVLDEEVEGGVVFGSSRCAELLADARALAIEDAGQRIEGLGQGTPGDIVKLQEQASDVFGFDLSPCDSDRLPTNEYGEPDVSSFDARPEVTIRAGVVVSRALA